MAAVNVTDDAVTYNQLNGPRVIVRNSSGIPYVLTVDEDTTAIDIWKGDGTTPTSFTVQDASNNPSSGVLGSASMAIDSSDVIHVSFMEDVGKVSDYTYNTFDTSTDQWGTPAVIDSDLGADPGSIDNLYSAIAIDANDIPHVVYTRYDSNMGGDYQTLTYNNRIGGAWNGSGIEIEGATATVSVYSFDIAIDADNLPVVSYFNQTDAAISAAQGNANDASSFNLFVVADFGASTDANSRWSSIAVDSNGNHHVAYAYTITTASDVDVRVRTHNYGDTWTTTWQTEENVYNSGTVPFPSGSIVCDGTDRYLFIEDQDNDIEYFSDTGSGWSGKTELETGTYNTVKAKWAFWIDNDSTGALVSADTYYFDGSDVAASDPDAVWTNETNADDGDINTDAASSTSGSRTSNELEIQGTNAPASGSIIISVLARFHNGTSFSSYVPVSAPGGSWTYAKLQALEMRIWNQLNNNLVITADGDAESGTVLATLSPGLSGGITTISKVELLVYTNTSRAASNELDYTFADEVTNQEDIFFNSLTLAEPEPTTHGEGYTIITS